MKFSIFIILFSSWISFVKANESSLTPVDLTKGNTVDRKQTYSLGATGLRGWIHTKAASDLDSGQGRTTAVSRQILVTHIGKKSPADGVMKVDDVILGIAGKLFMDDARKSFALAIQEAEKEANHGILKLMIWRGGKPMNVELKLHVMGTYSATAPFDCPKSKLIYKEACDVLEKEPMNGGWAGAVNGLALLATGDHKYDQKLHSYARQVGNRSLSLKGVSVDTWNWGYINLFLCEYFLATGDKEVFHAIEEYSVSLAKGQGTYGTFGHGGSELTENGQLHGPIPPYGPVNAAGLVANMSIVMGKKCGVKDPEVEAAIIRATNFFSYYVDKGAIPYGEHMPWPYHENNGKNAMTSLFFALQGNKTRETQFFAKMLTASYPCREYGHTGQGFSYLWGGLGVNTGGPLATAAYFKQASWHFDLSRRCDGSFTYDGDEQYGGSKINDDTYFTNASYNGLSPTASYVLTYALPLKKICITGRDSYQGNWLGQKDVDAAIYSGHFDLTRKSLTPDQLIEAFGDWSPIVRGWAAEELGTRPAGAKYAKRLITMAEDTDGFKRQGAAEALGYINDPAAAKMLARLLTHEDRWLRVKAANSLKKMQGNARPVLTEMLQALVDTAEPLYPMVLQDPIQLTQSELAQTIFGGLLSSSIEGINPKLLYPAIRAVACNPNSMARATLGGTFRNLLSSKDIEKLAPELVESAKVSAPADTMFSADIRMGALIALTKNHYKEGIEAGMAFLKNQGGHGSEIRTGEILKLIASYGKAASSVIPELKTLSKAYDDQTNRNQFPVEQNKMRTTAISDAIRSIESATTQPQLKTVSKALEKIVKSTKSIKPIIPDIPTTQPSNSKFSKGDICILTTPEGADLPATALLKDFPLLVRLNKENFDFGQVKANGDDIRFTDSAGVQLAYQVEEWNSAEGYASIWVRVPLIKGNSRQMLHILWGIKDAGSKSDGNSVFNESNGYLSVLHMNDSVKDETGNLDCRDNATTTSKGMIAMGRHLASGQGLSADNISKYPTGSSPHTSEAWFRAEKSNGTILGWGNDKNQEKVVLALRSPSRVNVDTYGSNADVSGSTKVALSEWTHIAHTYENGDSRIYVNGLLDNTSKSKDNPLNLTSPSSLVIGSWQGTLKFVGDIDEVRISKVKRSTDWIKLEYENQKQMQTAVGQIVQPGTDFSVIPQELTMDEGTNQSVSGLAGGALKVYWILKSKGVDTVISTDRFSVAFDAGRVKGDQQAVLQFKAIYPQGVKTRDIPITIKEAIADPLFTLKAPKNWDGRNLIEVIPKISNMSAMKVTQLSDLKITWNVGNVATSQLVTSEKLILKRAEKSGSVVVSATISNGGTPVTKLVTIIVTEPKQDPWVAALPIKNEQPEEGQFYARDDKNEGTITCNGLLTEMADSAFLRVYADNRLYRVLKSELTTDKSYAFTVKIRPGLITYKVEFGTTTGGKETILKTANNLVCGDAYLISGQSNAVASSWGDKEFPETSEWIRSFGAIGEDPKTCRWGTAVRRSKNDQLAIGYWAFDLAKNLMVNHKVPICMINGAVGGTRIDLHQRNPENHQDLGTIYGRLLWRVQQAKLTHGIRGVFWHQGENDQGADGPSGGYGWENYRQNFIDMTAAWKQDYPNIQHYYMFQIWPSACSMGENGSDNHLREVQRNLPKEYSKLSIMSTLGIDPPGNCHFTPDGYAEFARLLLPLVEHFNYGQMQSKSITPPNLKKVYYSSEKQDEVVLRFDQPVVWNNSTAAQLFLDGEEGKIVSGTVQANSIKLKLAATSSFKSITYIDGRSWEPKNLIRGENGIAALSFSEVPISNLQK
jgi:hypothetical protein